MSNSAEKFLGLVALINRLRAPDGCPWDRKQTPQSFKSYLVEETHELLEAIHEDQAPHICEELGDLLFQVLFLCNLYQEKGLFTLEGVLDGITNKMIRRHPHVFAEKQIGTEQELRRQWEFIKSGEVGNKEPAHPLDSIPKSLPSLTKAHKAVDYAARKGFDWPDLNQAMDKVAEEWGELRQACKGKNSEAINEELGDVLFTLAVVGRKAGLDSEASLNGAVVKFRERFKKLEARALAQGSELEQQALESLLDLWREIKKDSKEKKKS